MLEHYYKIISERYNPRVLMPGIYRQRNALSIVIFCSIRFYLIFYDEKYTVIMEAEDGTEVDIIGRKRVNDQLTDEIIMKTMDYLVEYVQLRIGYKFFCEEYDEY